MAQSPWESDGTQPPAPPPVWTDPSSGLVTGATYDQEPLHIDVVRPVEPDLSEVRRAVDAALQDEEAAAGDSPPTVPVPRQDLAVALGQPPGIVPANPRPGWQSRPSVRQLPGFRPRPPARIQRVRRPGSGGVAIATTVGVLLLAGVIITIIIMIIVSLSNTIDSIFN
ncbi:hypothetical protein [Actinophytocola sp.]|uniref:hypothetical protein n=1 Tax=Actinophytocola sp. TaxID=1872138 RepID=UPI002D7E2712|nr:hypothetical protein [Actinophytocola sp.]HET9139693.1 hypothetical protein [Actinophytocola sp.]